MALHGGCQRQRRVGRGLEIENNATGQLPNGEKSIDYFSPGTVPNLKHGPLQIAAKLASPPAALDPLRVAGAHREDQLGVWVVRGG